MKSKMCKKILVLMLSICMLLSGVVMPETVWAKDTDSSVWNGKAEAITTGNGSEESPYLIENAEQFAYMLWNNPLDKEGNAAHYKLMTDVYLNDIDKMDFKNGALTLEEGYRPNQWNAKEFSGTIDGNGHMVYGLYIEKNPISYTGNWGDWKFGALIQTNKAEENIQVSNLGFDYVHINVPTVSAVLIGITHEGSSGSPTIQIDGCYIGEKVSVQGYHAAGFLGDGYGDKATIRISNSACLASNLIAKGGNAGGLIGNVWNMTANDDMIQNCYSVTNIHGNWSDAGCYSNNYKTYPCGSKENDTSSVILALKNMQGSDVLTNGSKMSNLGAGYQSTKRFPIPTGLYKAIVGEEFTPGQVWTGETNSSFQGRGTKKSPYLISTAEQLAYAVSSGGNGKYYKLTSDIYLNDISKINWETGALLDDGYTVHSWYKGGTDAGDVLFSGTIDGDGHRVYGLYVNDTYGKDWGFWSAYGLIPRASGNATLLNIGIEYAYLNGPTAVGGLFGASDGANVIAMQCYVGQNVTLDGGGTGAFLGISSGSFTFNDCYSLARLKSTINQGLVGDYWFAEGHSGSFKACFNGNGEGSTKENDLVKTSNVYANAGNQLATVLAPEQMQGTVFTGNQMALSDNFVATDGYPQLRIFQENRNTSWNGLAHGYMGGNGSLEDPYLIADAGQLAYAVATAGDGGKYYKLTNDIYLNELDKIDWNHGEIREGSTYTPNYWFTGYVESSKGYNGFSVDCVFEGNVDGNGYTVFGLLNTIETQHTAAGLFPAAENTTITNLTLSHSYILARRFVGGISSYFNGSMSGVTVDDTVTLCYQEASTYFESSAIGGLIGYSSTVELTNCTFTGNMLYDKKPGYMHGLVGTSWNTPVNLNSCISAGWVPAAPSCSSGWSDEAKKGTYKAQGVYTDATVTGEDIFGFTHVDSSAMKGSSALSIMSGLSQDIWTVTEGGYPQLRICQVAHGDINGDGNVCDENDVVLMKKILVEEIITEADVNRNGKTDSGDLVALLKDESKTYKDGTVYSRVHFDGYEGYYIQYPKDNMELQSFAESLQNKMQAKGITLEITDDDCFEPEKVIRIAFSGDTDSNDYSVTMQGKILTIVGGNQEALSSAIDLFAELSSQDRVAILSGVYQPHASITLASGNTYNYVWGDEFSGTTLDKTKWVSDVLSTKMFPYTDLKLLDTEEAIKVQDGALQLTAKKYVDSSNSKIKYAAPASVHTQGKMEYRYGYMEIKAEVPFQQGVFPSFWTQSCGVLSENVRKAKDYYVEVDAFEVFGKTNQLEYNLHKWYTDKTHTKYDAKTPEEWTCKYIFDATQSDSYGYHTYGVEWTPEKISMYVDGQCRWTFDITKTFDSINNMDGFGDPLFVIFNNHLFTEQATWKANELPAFFETATFKIDYFRIYQSDSVEGSAIWTSR